MNITTVTIQGCHSQMRYTPTLFQYDYGQILKIEGVELPDTFQAHFCNVSDSSAITVLGSNNQVQIPDQFLNTGEDILCYIYLHTGEEDGETEYKILIPVTARQSITDEEPTPEEQSIIDQLVSALNTGVARAETAATNAEASEGNAKTSEDNAKESELNAKASEESALQAKDDAEAAKTEAEQAAQRAESSEQFASDYADEASDSATLSQSWAVGGTGTRQGEDTNNSKYYAESAISAKDDAVLAKTQAESARDLAVQAKDSAQASAQTATQKASEATQSAANASQSASSAQASATDASQSAALATSAKEAAQTAQGLAEDARDDAVTAKDDAETAQQEAEAAAQSISEEVVQIAINTQDISALKSALETTNDRIDAIEEAEGLHRYGVSGIGQAAAALTRLWDAVGMTAQVGTDGDNSSVINNFDDVTPFNRRKCVGNWTLVDGEPVFHVRAYYGDEEYTEDGSMGDYVAVECPRAYYYLKDGVLGVSAHQYQGWRPFDIFCHHHNPETTLPYVYLPAYALALKDGKAVSLPGLNNYQGTYKAIMNACRTYDSEAGQYAFCQPMAVNFYEWALFTVEFATQNCQAIMQGCAGLRHNNDDRATLRDDGKWLLSNYYASRVVGEYVSIQPTNIDINHASYFASHKIISITRCDADGNASASGTHQLVETEDLGLGRAYVVGEQYRFAARPYQTGSCNGVSTPSGSPVSNTSSYYPMKYRWRENVYANQFKTIADLFGKRVQDETNAYYLEWYFLLDPSTYTPSSASKPDSTDLATDAFVKLDMETAPANYANGYVKSKKYSDEYPDVWIPDGTTGASASTYFCDYADLVTSAVVRSVRVGGYWYSGASDGFSFFNGYYAPSSGYAFYGGDLFFPQ